MKPARIYNCETCHDSGYVRTASGLLEPCPNCRLGIVALAQSPCWTESPPTGAAEAACGVAKSAAPPDSRWTPAQVGRVLRILLYVGVATALWLFNHYAGGNTTVADKEGLGESHAPGSAAVDDFSLWEPEP